MSEGMMPLALIQCSSCSDNLMQGRGILETSYSETGFTAVSQLLKIRLHVLYVRGYQGISL